MSALWRIPCGSSCSHLWQRCAPPVDCGMKRVCVAPSMQYVNARVAAPSDSLHRFTFLARLPTYSPVPLYHRVVCLSVLPDVLLTAAKFLRLSSSTDSFYTLVQPLGTPPPLAIFPFPVYICNHWTDKHNMHSVCCLRRPRNRVVVDLMSALCQLHTCSVFTAYAVLTCETRNVGTPKGRPT